jgi:CheY-like chemotaxis protein
VNLDQDSIGNLDLHGGESLSAKSAPSRQSHALCFIDDDPTEIARFVKTFEKDFLIGTGTTITEAEASLREQGGKKPDLYLLDLYYSADSRASTREQLDKLAAARQKLLKAESAFRKQLAELGQYPEGGYKLAEQLTSKSWFGKPRYVFFTRKGTIEDENRALRQGAIKVIKKPDPNDEQMKAASLAEAYSLALESRSAFVKRDIEEAIEQSSWWRRWQGVITSILTFLIGVLASLFANMITKW